jgi:hypothetical protein
MALERAVEDGARLDTATSRFEVSRAAMAASAGFG